MRKTLIVLGLVAVSSLAMGTSAMAKPHEGGGGLPSTGPGGGPEGPIRATETGFGAVGSVGRSAEAGRHHRRRCQAQLKTCESAKSGGDKEQLKTQAKDIVQKATQSIRGVLTPEQKTKLREIMKEHAGKRSATQANHIVTTATHSARPIGRDGAMSRRQTRRAPSLGKYSRVARVLAASYPFGAPAAAAGDRDVSVCETVQLVQRCTGLFREFRQTDVRFSRRSTPSCRRHPLSFVASTTSTRLASMSLSRDCLGLCRIPGVGRCRVLTRCWSAPRRRNCRRGRPICGIRGR